MKTLKEKIDAMLTKYLSHEKDFFYESNDVAMDFERAFQEIEKEINNRSVTIHGFTNTRYISTNDVLALIRVK